MLLDVTHLRKLAGRIKSKRSWILSYTVYRKRMTYKGRLGARFLKLDVVDVPHEPWVARKPGSQHYLCVGTMECWSTQKMGVVAHGSERVVHKIIF